MRTESFAEGYRNYKEDIMAKLEKELWDDLVDGEARCSVRVFERYSTMGF